MGLRDLKGLRPSEREDTEVLLYDRSELRTRSLWGAESSFGKLEMAVVSIGDFGHGLGGAMRYFGPCNRLGLVFRIFRTGVKMVCHA